MPRNVPAVVKRSSRYRRAGERPTFTPPPYIPPPPMNGQVPPVQNQPPMPISSAPMAPPGYNPVQANYPQQMPPVQQNQNMPSSPGMPPQQRPPVQQNMPSSPGMPPQQTPPSLSGNPPSLAGMPSPQTAPVQWNSSTPTIGPSQPLQRSSTASSPGQPAHPQAPQQGRMPPQAMPTPPPSWSGVTPGPPQPPQALSAPPARILVELDGKVVARHQLTRPALTVGRHNGSDIQVPNQRVSRLHAKILAGQGVWIIEDAESVNGIMYKGNRVKRMALSSGDRIYLAPDAVIQFET